MSSELAGNSHSLFNRAEVTSADLASAVNHIPVSLKDKREKKSIEIQAYDLLQVTSNNNEAHEKMGLRESGSAREATLYQPKQIISSLSNFNY